MSERNLRAEMRALQQARELKWNDIAGSIGVSRSTINLWMRGKYEGNNDGIAEKVAKFIDMELERDPNQDRTLFVETSIARKVLEVAKETQKSGIISLCVGRSGVGKTRAIREYAHRHPGVILLEAHMSYSVADLFRDLHRITGGSGRGTIHQMMRDIVETLHGTRRLLIVDEAEHMKVAALDQLRRLHDWTGVGLMYVGTKKFRHTLAGHRSDFDYIVNRVGLVADLDSLKKKDAEAIVQAYMPEAAALSAVFHECSGGVTRTLVDGLIYNVKRVDGIASTGVDAELIRQIASELKV